MGGICTNFKVISKYLVSLCINMRNSIIRPKEKWRDFSESLLAIFLKKNNYSTKY